MQHFVLSAHMLPPFAISRHILQHFVILCYILSKFFRESATSAEVHAPSRSQGFKRRGPRRPDTRPCHDSCTGFAIVSTTYVLDNHNASMIIQLHR